MYSKSLVVSLALFIFTLYQNLEPPNDQILTLMDVRYLKGIGKSLLVIKGTEENVSIWCGGGEQRFGFIEIFNVLTDKTSVSKQTTLDFDDAIHSMCLVSQTKGRNEVWAGSYSQMYVIGLNFETRKRWQAHPASRINAIVSVGNEVWSCGNEIFVWDKTTFAMTKVLQMHSGPINCLEVVKAPNGNLHVWSGSFDKTIIIWDAKSHDCLRQLHGHTDTVHCLVSTRIGRLYSGGYRNDKTLKCWVYQ